MTTSTSDPALRATALAQAPPAPDATPFWLWVFWHAGFAVAILRYTAVSRQPAVQGHAALRALLAVLGAVAVLIASAKF